MAVALAALIVGLLTPVTPATATTCTDTSSPPAYGGGNGEADTPFQIGTKAHLEALRNRVNVDAEDQDGCHFVVQADLDLGDWDPIGTETLSSSGKIFRGTFDGDDRTITLAITGSDNQQGLFGVVDGATVTNVRLRGSVSGGRNVGGVAGLAFAFPPRTTTIEADVDLDVDGVNNVGGLFGQWSLGTLTVRDTTVRGTVDATDADFSGVGTFIGSLNAGPLTLVGANVIGANVTAAGLDAGCLVGGNYASIAGPDVVFESGSSLTVAGVTRTCPIVDASSSDREPAAGPSFVAPGGVQPEQPAGVGEWVQPDGSAVPLTVSSPGVNQLRYEADGVQVTFTGGPGSDVSRGLVANPEGEVVCEICLALAAGQVIEAWMFSEPRLVAAWRIEDLPCQRFTIPVASPLDGGGAVAAGAHTLQLALPTASGMQAVNVGVTVGGPVPASVPAGEGPAAPAGLLLAGLVAAVFGLRRLAVAAAR